MTRRNVPECKDIKKNKNKALNFNIYDSMYTIQHALRLKKIFINHYSISNAYFGTINIATCTWRTPHDNNAKSKRNSKDNNAIQ